MPDRERSDDGRRRWLFGLLVVGMAGYALGAATTTAFTQPANVLTALPIVIVAVLVVVRWPLRPHPRRGAAREDGTHPFRAWVILFAAVVAWELVEYASRGSRAAHPTLSSMLDAVDRYYLLKALIFFGWLYLGAAIVRKGRAATATAPAPATAAVPPAEPPGGA